MNLDHSLEILQALADGVDPYTGERFPDDGPYQRANTVRALYAAIDAIKNPSAKPKKPVDPDKPRAGGPWTPEEEQKLRDAFAAKNSFEQIAQDHGRTRGAITSRLVKLGLISLDDQPRNERPPPNVRTTPLSPNPIAPPLNPPVSHPVSSPTAPPAAPPAASRSPRLPPVNFDPKDCPF